jgi:hypothetical protein
VAKYGAIFIEADLPSPLMGYPGAFGIDLKGEQGNWPAIMKKVEKTISATKGKGRMGTWAYSYGYTGTAGLAEYAKRMIEGKAKPDSLKDLLKSYEKYTPGAQWNASNYIDKGTGVKMKNYFLVYQDTYIFGKGYLNMTSVKVPAKYFKIK